MHSRKVTFNFLESCVKIVWSVIFGGFFFCLSQIQRLSDRGETKSAASGQHFGEEGWGTEEELT